LPDPHNRSRGKGGGATRVTNAQFKSDEARKADFRGEQVPVTGVRTEHRWVLKTSLRGRGLAQIAACTNCTN